MKMQKHFITGTILKLRRYEVFLISNFLRVLNAVFFLLGDSSAYEFYVPTFQNTVCSIFIGGASLPRLRRQSRQCSETSSHNIQTSGNHPKERIQKKYCLTFHLERQKHLRGLCGKYPAILNNIRTGNGSLM